LKAKPGYFILTPVAPVIWNLVERFRIPLPGRLAAILFGLMIQVLVSGTGRNPRVGFLGVLNGLFGTRDDGWGEISAIFDKSEKLVRFERTPRIAIERETVICE
jgi:hypothetical protein